MKVVTVQINISRESISNQTCATHYPRAHKGSILIVIMLLSATIYIQLRL
jgi:hypothetical protein